MRIQKIVITNNRGRRTAHIFTEQGPATTRSYVYERAPISESEGMTAEDFQKKWDYLRSYTTTETFTMEGE